MNLLKLMESAVPPPVLADTLIQRFDQVDQQEILAGGWPFQYLFVVGDQLKQRLVILFAHFNGRWQYQIHAPWILRTLRTTQ